MRIWAGQMYPDQSLYPANSVPAVVRAINNALLRADQICRAEGRRAVLVRADRGRCGSRIRRPSQRVRTDEGDDRGGRGGVHFEDQLSSAKKCGHLGGKVVVPIREFVQKLIAARLAADVWACRRF